MSFLKAQVIFPSNFASIFSSIENNSSLLFLTQTLFALVKSSLLKCKFLRFSSAWVKICQIPQVNFELTSQFLLNFCIIIYCRDTYPAVNFKLIHFQLQTKGYHQGPNLETFKCSGENLPNSPYQFLEAQASFTSNFVSIQNAIKHNQTPLSFKLIHFLLCIKRSNESPNFENFMCSSETFAKFLMPFSKLQVNVSSNFASHSSVIKYSSSVLFQLKYCILWSNIAH